jgi:hypothetical protein
MRPGVTVEKMHAGGRIFTLPRAALRASNNVASGRSLRGRLAWLRPLATLLAPGTVEAVQATWTAAADRTTNAPYFVYDGDQFLERVRVNQQERPVGMTVGGAIFQPLEAFTVRSGTLRVVLSSDANGSVSADAVRLVRLDDIPAVVPPAAPAPYSLPSGAVRVTTSAELLTALQGAARDIVLADGAYDNPGPFFDYGAHHFYAEHLGGAVLRAGVVIGSNPGPGGGLEGVGAAFLAQQADGDAAQFVVHQPDQPVLGRGIALLHGAEEPRHLPLGQRGHGASLSKKPRVLLLGYAGR